MLHDVLTTCRSWVPTCQLEAVQAEVLVSERDTTGAAEVPKLWDLMPDDLR